MTAANLKRGPINWATLCLALLYCLAFATYLGAGEASALYPLARGSVKDGNLKYGFLDTNGRIVIPAQYEWAGKFVDDRAQVRLGGKIGYIDMRGQLIVPAIYELGGDYSEGVAVVRSKHNEWSVIDRDGHVIVPPKYGWIGAANDGLLIVSSQLKGGQPVRYGAVDTSGRLVINLTFEGLGTFREGRAPAKINGKYGYIAKDGHLTIPPTYDHANSFIDGLANVGVKDSKGRIRQGIINIDGTYIIPPEHDYVQEFKDGKSVVIDQSQGDTFQIFDRTGARLVANINPKSLCDRNPYGQWHADNLTVLKSTNGKCFYVDSDGRNRFAREFERAWPFANGLAVVWVTAEEAFGGKSIRKRQFAGIIDDRGAFVTPAIFDEIWIESPDVIRVRWKSNREDYLDRSGRPLSFSDADLRKYIEDMRAYYAPIPHDPSRTITARAADGEYYLSLPQGFCVLDDSNAADARIFDEARKQASAAEEVLNRKGQIRGADDGGKAEHAQQPVLSGLFAPCDELHEYQATGDRHRLTRLGTATGTRRKAYDPSTYGAIVYASRMICGMLRGGGSSGLRQQTERSRSERIAEAWKQAASGTAAQLNAIDDHLLGCTSVALKPDGQGEIAAIFIALAFLPDWNVTSIRTVALKSNEELVELLQKETKTITAITQAAMDAMDAEVK